MALINYQTFVFDCDGVIMDSNQTKSDAFYQTALAYGKNAAEEFLDYHVRNGGVSRYEKFEHFLKVIVPKYDTVLNGPTIKELLDNYATQVRKALMSCEIAPGLQQLRKMVPNATWCVVSGGDQEELRSVFKARQISNFFNGGIFGSPDSKHSIITCEITNNNITQPAIFLGDSRLDHEVAKAFKIDFIFLSKWTEFKEWKTYCSENNINTVESIDCLLEDFKLR